MTNVVVESVLKALIDADDWDVDPDGVTKLTYIWANSNAINLDLDDPGSWNNTANQVVIVIHPSTRSNIGKSSGSDNFSWIGEMKIFANTAANISSASDLLKAIADANQFLEFHEPGLNGNPKIGKYWKTIIYHYVYNVSH